MIAGDPWSHAPDVCRCLDLSLAVGAVGHTRKLKRSETLVISPSQAPIYGKTTHGWMAIMAGRITFVSESGLYKLILRAHPSRPEVQAFQDWVTQEVLPSIRKTGGYQMNTQPRLWLICGWDIVSRY